MAKKALRLAAADVGSNSIHLIIADVDKDQLKIILRHEMPTRLSQDVDDDGRISLDKMTQVAAVLNLFKSIVDSYDVNKFLCIATEATRSSNNSDQFVEFLRDRCGLDLQVISGEVEAALTFRGATYDHKLYSGQLVVDIGGGSTELIASNRHQVDWLMSIPIGSGRMTDRFIESDPPAKREIKKLRRYLDRVFARVEPDHKIRDVIFTGGTMLLLQRVAARDQAVWKMKDDDLKRAEKRLRKVPAYEIGRLYQTELERAQVLAAAIAIAQSIMNRFKLHDLRISPQGLRSGLVLTYAQYGDDWAQHLISPDVVRAPSPLDRANES